jgi:hypothetical protein
MDFFECSAHLPDEAADFPLCDKDYLGSTCEVKDEPPGDLHIDPFFDSSEIECDAFAMLYSPEEDSPAPPPLPSQPLPAGTGLNAVAEKQPQKRMKNSNVIKKIGRMILSRLEEFELPNGPNPGVENMLQGLSTQLEAGRRPDSFNTSHLQALYDVSGAVSAFNLRTTRRMFSREMRREVFTSKQLKGKSPLVYLNTFKCSGLRFMSRRLASRLQASESP